MGRGVSRFERAWRERAGHAEPVAAAPAVIADVPASGVEPATPAGPPAAGADQVDAVARSGRAIALSFKSSNVREAVFDGTTGIVEVTFKDGKSYRYLNFTDELMDQWRTAKSAGSWFHEHVKSKPDLHPIVPAGA